MTRVAISADPIPSVADDGYNLTDSADFEVMATGAGNGVEFTFNNRTVVVLKNTTGGGAVYTFKFPAMTNITAVGGAVTEPTIDVATGKTHILKPTTIFKQSDGKVYVDCDVAGAILILSY